MNKVSKFAFRLPVFMCPTHLQEDQSSTSMSNGTWIEHGHDALAVYQGHCIQFPYNNSSNLPTVKLALGIQHYQAFHVSVNNSSDPVTQRTDNLSPASWKLMCLHHCLGHKGFHDLQKWAAKGINSIPSDITTCPILMCHACQYSAAKK